jgi:hypothetical protein
MEVKRRKMIRSDKKMTILLTMAFLFASCALLCVTAAGSSGPSYDVYVKTSGGWAVQEERQFSKYYETASIDLSGLLPDADGEYKVRIAQQGGIAAHIDYVALCDGAPISPTSATCIDNDLDVLQKVVQLDNDVADAWGKTIECTWENSVSSPVLIVNANIEHYTIEAPILTPCIMRPELMLPYVITNNGIIAVDGVPDSLGAPDFSDYWTPTSGHPCGYTYLWLRSDGEYLYGLMEITSDNTYDETGWGSLYINANGALKEFRVDVASHTYGIDGFVYTDTVPWQHMVYEFKIPRSELGVGVGDSIKIGYGGYGTEHAPVQVGKRVATGHLWADQLTAWINDTLHFGCFIKYYASGPGYPSSRRFWDVLDCSLVFAGNATLNGEPYSELNDGGPYTFKPKVLHPHNLSWDPYDPNPDPASKNFTALCPDAGSEYHIDDWNDTNGDFGISVCDQLYLTSAPGTWYHVDNVPVTLNVTNTETAESMYIDTVDDWQTFILSPVNGSQWLGVCCCKDLYYLSEWNDTDVTNTLSVNDTMILLNTRTGQEARYLVNEITRDLVVSKEWPLNDSLASGEYIIEYDVRVIRCGIDYNRITVKGWYDDVEYWLYGNSTVMITVLCPEGNATDDIGTVVEEYTTEETVYATGSGFKRNGTVDVSIVNDSEWFGGEQITNVLIHVPNVPTDEFGNIVPTSIWPNPNPGEYDMVFDDPDGYYNAGIDAVDNPTYPGPGFIVRAVPEAAEVPLVMPLGIAALIGLLSVVAISRLVRRKKR